MQHIGKNIKSIISKSKYSAKDISSELDVSYQYLYKIFNSESVDTKYLFKLSEILDVPVTAFFPEESANWNNKDLIAKNVALDIRNQDLEENIDLLQDIIRTKRSLLKLVYNYLKILQDNRLDDIIMAIDGAEKFEETDQELKKMKAERNKTKIEGKSKYELQKELNERMKKRSETDIPTQKDEKDTNATE